MQHIVRDCHWCRFSVQCVSTLQQLRICSLHSVECLWKSLVSFSVCLIPNNSHAYHTVVDCLSESLVSFSAYLVSYSSYERVPYIIIVDCSSESLVSFSVCLVSPEQLRICSLHNYSIIILLVLIVPYNSYECGPYNQKIVCDNRWCRSLLVLYIRTVTNMFLACRSLFVTMAGVAFCLSCN